MGLIGLICLWCVCLSEMSSVLHDMDLRGLSEVRSVFASARLSGNIV